MTLPMSATVSPISSPSTPPPAMADGSANQPIGRDSNQMPPALGAWPHSSAPTLDTENLQPPVTARGRPAPKELASATYTALPTEDGQTGSKDTDTAYQKPRRGCWEAFQDLTWGFELLALLFAMASTVAVCVVLGQANNRQLSDWTLPIQPNSLISVFSTLAKAALMAPIASVVSQMKWIWFEEPRNLANLQSFDRASRGPWGAANLIWGLPSIGRGWITRAACILTIAALAFDPTAQQVISFETRETQVFNATALLSVASNWTSSSLNLQADLSSELPQVPKKLGEVTLLIRDRSAIEQIGMQSSLLNAVGPRPRDLVPKFECTAPTCSWDQVETLGACSACWASKRPTWSLLRNDSTSFIAAPPANLTFGPRLTEAVPFDNLTMQPPMSMFDMTAGTMMDASGKSFSRFVAVNYSTNTNAGGADQGTWSWRQNDTVDYYMCRIHPCIQTFERVTVRNGVYMFDNRTTEWLIPENETRVSGQIIYHPEEPGSVADWILDFDTAQKVNQVFAAMLQRNSILRFSNHVHDLVPNSDIRAALSHVVFENGPAMVMDAFANVLSAEMRSDDNIAVQNHAGASWEPRTFIVVNWLWMICPLALVAATMVILAVAMVRTSKHPLAYKDSAIALLSLGIGHMDPTNSNKAVRGDTVGQRYTAYQVEAEASGVTARLYKDGNGDFMMLKC